MNRRISQQGFILYLPFTNNMQSHGDKVFDICAHHAYILVLWLAGMTSSITNGLACPSSINKSKTLCAKTIVHQIVVQVDGESNCGEDGFCVIKRQFTVRSTILCCDEFHMRIWTHCSLMYVARVGCLVLTKQRNWFIKSMKNWWSIDPNEILHVDLKKPGCNKISQKNFLGCQHSRIRYRYMVSKSPFAGVVSMFEVDPWRVEQIVTSLVLQDEICNQWIKAQVYICELFICERNK